jgi:AraC-like DNA-binding protein
MLNWLLTPNSPDVAKYIECFWLIEKRPDSQSYQYPKLNPDPCAHLIISPTNQAFHYANNSGACKGVGSHWLFPHHQTFQLDHSEPFVHLGVKFHVGALYSLNVPDYAHPMLDTAKSVSLTTLLNEAKVCENELIEIARRDPKKCCEKLEASLQAWLKKSKEDQHSKITRKVLPLLSSTPISALGSTLFCSQRTIERSFSRVAGITLKQCQSMNKLEAMLEYLYQRDSKDIDWVDVAFQFGFSDQPHLIRHLKEQIGLTPKAYAKERGLTIDVYGGVNSS